VNSSKQNSAWSFGSRVGQTRWSDALATRLLMLVDAGLAATICAAPFVFGGRHDLGRLVFVTLVALTSIAWFTRQCLLSQATWSRSWAFVLLLVATAFVGLQLAPLPADWLARLAPRTAELLPVWTTTASPLSLGSWATLSLTPHETTLALATLASYVLLFTVVCQRIETTRDVERLLNSIAVAAVLMAAFGLVQFFASNGNIFWFYVHPFRTTDRSAMGSFMNRNHFASFLVLGVGPLVRWLVATVRVPNSHGGRRGQQPTAISWLRPALLVAGLIVVLLAILLSFSRGGALALAAATLVVSVIYWRWKLIDGKYLAGLTAVALLMLGLLSIYGYDQIANRLDDFVSGTVESLDAGEGRRRVWVANVEAIEHGGLFGSGAGSHLAVCPVYLREPTTKYYTHAEDGYLQIATENGWIGVTLLALGLGLIVAWCITCLTRLTDPAQRLCFGAAAAGIAASLVHSVVDFVWYVPACVSVTLVLAVAILRLSQFAASPATQQKSRPIWPRARWIECTAVVTLVALWTVYTYVGPGFAAVHWERYQCDIIAHSRIFGDASLPTARRPSPSELAMREPLEASIERHLQETLRWDPSFARAHLRLAAHYVQRFERQQQAGENVLPPNQIRDAAFAARFASLDQQHAWLRRAFGPQVDWLFRAEAHARQAIALSPLNGDGYVFLANLGFLNGDAPELVSAYVDQAIRVRPYDGEVAYEAGKEALELDNLEPAMPYFSRCFGTPGPHQLRVVGLLAGRIPASEFIERFHPDWRTLRPIWNAYRQTNRPEDLQALVAYASQVTARDADDDNFRPAYLWLAQAQMYTDLGQPEQTLTCLMQAYQCDSHVYEVRRMLGFALKSAERYAEAEPHLRWCLSRRPDDKSLSGAIVEIGKLRVISHDNSSITAKLGNQVR
jgi:O-antigen ligase/tetratricopeptide (TPR) repeat protein